MSNYGLTSLVYGTPAVTGYVSQNQTISSKPNLIVEVMNETGKRVAVHYDDVTNELSWEGVFNGATLPTPGGTFTVNSILYECVGVDVKTVNNGVKTVSIKGKNSEGVSLP